MGLPFVSDQFPDLISMEVLYMEKPRMLQFFHSDWTVSKNLMFLFSCISASEQKQNDILMFMNKATSPFLMKTFVHVDLL